MSYSFSIFLKDYATSSISKISAGISGIESKVNSFGSKTLASTVNAGKGFDNLSGKINSTEKELNELNSGTERVSGKFSGLLGIASKLFIGFSAFEAVKALFNIGVQAEQSNVKFEVLLGSASKANKMLSDLTMYANKTPYSFKGLEQGAQTMLGFGIAEEKILPNMKMLGDVAMGNDEKLSGLSLVYSQIMATGKLMGQDLLQLINQGFNPLQTISDQTGISMGVLKGKMEQGAISSDMVSEAFRIATSEGGRYFGMSEKMSQSAGGKWSTMMDAFADVTKKVGLKFAEWIKPIFDVGTAFAEKIIPFGKWVIGFLPSIETFTTILQVLGVVIAAVGAYMLFTNAASMAWSVTLGILNGVIWLVEAAQWAWNIAMSLNPIGIVIAAIVALIAIVVILWNKFGWFRGAVLGVWEVLKGLGSMIKNYVINRFTELLNGITGIGKALISFIKGDFEGAIKQGAEAGKNLLGVNSGKKAFQDGKNAFNMFDKGWTEGNQTTTPKTVKAVQKNNDKIKSTSPKSNLFDSLLGDGGKGKEGKEGKAGKSKNPAKEKSDGIVSGGSKQTNIVININKLQDQTVIHVSNTEKGLKNLGDKVQEELLRAVNSVNQMQTS